MKKVERVVFEVGDVVQLKSGGPKMTVSESCEDHEIVEVVWDIAGAMQVNQLPFGVLEIAK